MDISEYLPMFLAEAREHLQELNLAVVRIEEQPDDRETVDEIFRIAHSLKGMSATMGFAGMAALTHEMEDVFELLRQRTGGLGRDAIDVLLACLDALEAAVDAIEATGAEADRPGAADRAPAAASSATARRTQARRARPAPPTTADVLPSWPAAAASCTSAPPRRRRRDARRPRLHGARRARRARRDRSPAARAEDAVERFAGTRDRRLAGHRRRGATLSRRRRADVPDVADAVTVPARRARGRAPPVAPIPRSPPQASRRRRRRAAAPPGAARAPATAEGRATTVRVDAERLDQLMHFMGELVVHRTHVEALAAGADVPGPPQAMQDLTRTSQALQAMVMQVRMIPVEAVFLRFPRLVRDLSTKLGKQVELELVGKDTELDRTVVDALGDPLVHLVRNALDHGLEPPEERAAAGKPATGTLEISARHAGGNVVITVRDDGRGIDPERVARKAAERGLITAEAARRSTPRAPSSCCSRPASRPPRSRQRHLRPRRRHGRGPHHGPRARRRGHC